MTALVTAKMQYLAESVAELKIRVRHALASELAQHVATAVADVVRAVVAGREFIEYRSQQPSWRRDPDPWDDDVDAESYSGYRSHPARESPADSVPMNAAVPLAVAAGIHTVRWWIRRRGGLLGAVGAGIGVGVLGLTGGTMVRAALAVLTAAADLLAVTDTLGDAASRLEQV